MKFCKFWMRSLLFLSVLAGSLIVNPMAMAGQSAAKGEESASGNATIIFISHCDMSQWFPDVTKLKWGLAISKDDIVVEKEGDTKTFNQPAVDSQNLISSLVLSDIPTGEEKSVYIEPGEYDWLILIDGKGDGSYPSHLGTTVRTVKQDKFKFEADKTYHILINPSAGVVMTTKETP
ncbi:MAG: hypothetical protein GY859_23550 [Desulfobacterales bacterium]|nr:hypothetical protein [Desulfobacterales bacterium]